MRLNRVKKKALTAAELCTASCCTPDGMRLRLSAPMRPAKNPRRRWERMQDGKSLPTIAVVDLTVLDCYVTAAISVPAICVLGRVLALGEAADVDIVK